MTKEKRESLTGFTFIELIIAVTIFAIIAVSIYSTFNAGIRIWLRTSPMIEANQSLRVFFDTISLDLKNSVAYYDTSGALVKPGFGEAYEGEINFEGAPARISFVTLINVSGPNLGLHEELAKITYVYDRVAKSVKRLVATKAEGFDEVNAKSFEMLTAIEEKDFGFEYCYKKMITNSEYEYEWKDAWEEKNVQKIPRGVRIKTGKASRKTVFILTGTLGEET